MCLIFILIYGTRVLNPGYVDWIFGSNADLIQHYVGFESFRFGDWMFPVGLTDATSYPLGISVIYTDSIPIMALFFKLVSFILPKTFQYFGIYGMLLFVLQGLVVAKIVRKFTDSWMNIIIVSILFVLVPSMIFRVFYHTALASHWLLLLGFMSLFLYDDFKNSKNIYLFWGGIAFLVSTIHIYYLLMCGIILIGYCLLDFLNTKNIKRSFLLVLVYLLVSSITIFLFGGFNNYVENDSFGFGVFSYNLNGLINSQGWSSALGALPMMEGQYEGFSYLGLGVILLILIAIVLVAIWFFSDTKDILKYKNLGISLGMISVVSLVLALSNKVYLGDKLLFTWKLPDFILDIWGVFRSTGRLIWPVIYILMLVSVIVILKRLDWKYAFLVLCFCTCVQLLDISGYLGSINEFYTQDFSNSYRDSVYSNKYLKKISDLDVSLMVMVDDGFDDMDRFVYADFAINNGMKINTFHFARTSFDDIIKVNTRLLLENIDDTMVLLFSSKDACSGYEVKCYKITYDYYLGYKGNLDFGVY